jgi:DNA adenine methylase Dam
MHETGANKYKCPFNYVGSKSRMLPVLLPILNQQSDKRLIDLFAGGFSVGANADNRSVVYNDVNPDLRNLMQYVYKTPADDLISQIEQTIDKYGLTKTDKEPYNVLRADFNDNRSPLLFCLLIFYSFNHQIRYNQKRLFNTPAGTNRSSFNNSIKENLLVFSSLIKKKQVEFYSQDFRDFNILPSDIIFVDPPYLITTGSYNDGKRGVSSWCEQDEVDLYEYLDEANRNGVKFVLTNALKNGENQNEYLASWLKQYNCETVDSKFNNYHRNCGKSVEVIVWN